MLDLKISEYSHLTWDLVPLVDILPQWLEQKDHLFGSITQMPLWVSSWQQHVKPDCFCIIAQNNEKIEFLLTLEVIKHRFFISANFPGESHANENFPCMSTSFASSFQDNIAIIRSLIQKKRPDIDVVCLERQIERLDNGLSNPILNLQHAVATDIALSFELESDFAHLIEKREKQNRHKKMRRMARQLEKNGGWSYTIASTPEEVDVYLAEFYRLKGKRLREKGLQDVFAPPCIQRFFNELFTQSFANNGFEIAALTVGDKIVALEGNSILRAQFSSFFIAVDDTEPNMSYGHFMNFESIQRACARGMKIFSDGTGDEPHKRYWSNIETPQYNMTVSMSWKGAFIAHAQNIKTRVFRWIKTHPRIFNWVKNLRKYFRKA